MAGPILVEFSDGPCNGQHTFITVAQAQTKAVMCGGTTYTLVSSPGPNTYRAIPAAKVEKGSQFATPEAQRQFGAAWTQLMRTLHDRIPASDKRANAAIQKIRKAVR